MHGLTESLIRVLRTEGLQIFQYLVEHSADAILMTNADLEIAYANHACNQLVDRTVIGQPLSSLWWKEDLGIYHHLIESAQVTSVFSTARVNGFLSVTERFPNIEIVGRLAADWDREMGYKAAEKFLRAHPPGTLDVIWAASGEMAMGALAAIEAAGRQAEVKLFSNDVTPESALLAQTGRLQAETHHGFADWGWYGAELGVRLALGLPVPPQFDIRPRSMYQANADRFYPTPVLEPIDWAAFKRVQPLPPQLTIGWIQAAATGVYETATVYFEKAAAEARAHGVNLRIHTQLLRHPNDFVGEAQIIESLIAERVNVIALSTVKVEVIRAAIRKATAAGIPVIVVNQLERIEETDVACYVGFDNRVAGVISGYAVVDHLGGPGVLGSGPAVPVAPDTELDLTWWESVYRNVTAQDLDVRGRVAIIEGVSGSWQGEHRLIRANGQPIHVDTITFPVHGKHGEFLGIAAALRDATRRKAIEAALKAYAEHQEELVSERTQDLHAAYLELQQENLERQRAEAEKELIINLLQDALDRVKHLSGLLPICASCKKIRDDKGSWHQLEIYIRDHSEAEFSHGICPDCLQRLYGTRTGKGVG